MPLIELQVRVSMPAMLVAPELVKALQAIEKGDRPFENFTVSADLGSLHLPNIGAVSVPVSLSVRGSHGRNPQRIDFALESSDASGFFPKFTGSLRCDPDGPSDAVIWLIGEYAPPLGTAGALLDATVLKGVATHSLMPFLRLLAEHAEAESRKHELDAGRAARLNA